MNTYQIQRVARALGTCISLTSDPTADPGERWVAAVGLEAIGAGQTPAMALRTALLDIGQVGVREDARPRLYRGRQILRVALK